MSKNPFVNCKSRKRRKKFIVTTPKPKGYCPRTMIRYDGTVYGTVWICKMCLTLVLSEEAVRAHILRCNDLSKPLSNGESDDKMNAEEMRYICEYCNRVYSRKVALKKHKEIHEKSSSGIESGESDVESSENP